MSRSRFWSGRKAATKWQTTKRKSRAWRVAGA